MSVNSSKTRVEMPNGRTTPRVQIKAKKGLVDR
jgi:hypothetical protein